VEIEGQRTAPAPFDIALGGGARHLVDGIVSPAIGDLDAMCARIAGGPVRI
jgi:hypothetical protein